MTLAFSVWTESRLETQNTSHKLFANEHITLTKYNLQHNGIHTYACIGNVMTLWHVLHTIVPTRWEFTQQLSMQVA